VFFNLRIGVECLDCSPNLIAAMQVFCSKFTETLNHTYLCIEKDAD